MTSLAYSLKDNALELRFPYDPSGEAQSRAKAIYGYRWSKARKTWLYPATVETARALVDAFEPDAGEGFAEWYARATKAQRAAKRAQDFLAGKIETVGDFGFTFTTTPYQHQRTYCEWAAQRSLAGLTYRAQFSEQGTGKTKSEIDMTVWELDKGLCTGVPLILCPNSVKREWASEINIHGPLGFFQPILLDGTAEDKLKSLEAMHSVARAGSMPVIIVNYDVLSQPSQHKVYQQILAHATAGDFGKIIMDEATMIKNVRSQRGNNAYHLARRIPIRVVMTGTPYPKALTDIFNLMRCLDAGILGTSWPAFRRHHVILGGWQNKEVVGYQNESELEEKVNRHTFRKLLAECTDMPEEVHLIRTCDLSKSQIKATRDLKNRFLTELETTEGQAWVVSATQAMTRLLRFNQITSGFIEMPDTGQVVRFSPNPKQELLLSILRDEISEGEKAVIWCCYRADVRELVEACTKAGFKAVSFYGETPKADRPLNEDAFKNDPEVRVMIATPDTGGFGLNWEVACNCIFYSYNWKWGDQEQAKSRIRRITQKNRMSYFWLVAENPMTRQASHGASTGINQMILGNLGETAKLANFMTGDFRKQHGIDPRASMRRALEVM